MSETGKPAVGSISWVDLDVVVADLDASLAECRARGGVVVAGPRAMGQGARFAVLRDPAGAVLELYQSVE